MTRRRASPRTLAGCAASALLVGACNVILGNRGTDVVDLREAAPGECSPRACDTLSCGPTEDGCGGAIDCGDCVRADYSCQAGTCACRTRECEGRCGFQPDGCEGEGLDCGQCMQGGLTCGGGTAGPDYCGTGVECVERTCQSTDGVARCGKIARGCGQGLLECGDCPSGLTCGGAGVANVCGCKPRTCEQLAVGCGTAIDPDCPGVPQECGTCGAGEVCDPATRKCGSTCTPTSDQCDGRCGTIDRGCGEKLSCPGCAAPTVCDPLHKCCDPEPLDKTCTGRQCGSVKDNCGQEVHCGSCAMASACSPAGTCCDGIIATTPCTIDGVTQCCGAGERCGKSGCCNVAEPGCDGP